MFVLGIDTSNATLSVALVDKDQTLIEVTEHTKNNQSERLMPVIDSIFKQINRQPKDLDLIAVAQGPGSYTGIRIGVTVAKLLAWTLNKPLVGVSSLEIVARNIEVDGLIIPMFDARRQSVFTGAYNGNNYDPIIPDNHYMLEQLLIDLAKEDQEFYFIGSGVQPYWDQISQTLGAKAHKLEEEFLNIPHASRLVKAALTKEPTLDIHGFVPTYHRISEAEFNWMKAQPVENHD